MRQAYGPNHIAQFYADKVMSFRMEEDRDRIYRDTAQRFEEKIRKDRIAAGLEVSNG